MPVALPTRLLVPTLEVCEDAIVAALAADAAILVGVPAASIKPFQGDLAQAMQEVAVRPPAILVMWAGGDIEPMGSEYFEVDGEWRVLVFARNMRSRKASSNPDAAGEVGAYQLVADVLRVLSLQHLDVAGMGELRPVACELLQAGSNKERTVTAYLVVFRCSVELQVVVPSTNLLEVRTTLESHRESTGTWPTDGGDNIPLTGIP